MVKSKECPACDEGTLRQQRVRETMFGADLGEFDAEVCDACGETFLDSEAMETLEARAKKAGVWGLGEKLKVVKSGNSLVIRIPARLARHLKLKSGTEVYVHPDGDDRIVVDVDS